MTPIGPGALLRSAVDPVVAIATLAATAAWFGARFDGAWLILAVLVFAMTFPGSMVRGNGSSLRSNRAVALDIVTGWIAIVSLLGLFGWASRSLNVFDARVLAAWALSTPV